MGITLSMTGAFRETGASFFFIPKGALTHHLRSRRWYPSLRSGRALCEADAAPAGALATADDTPTVSLTAAWVPSSPHILCCTATTHSQGAICSLADHLPVCGPSDGDGGCAETRATTAVPGFHHACLLFDK